jgi:hypothetical protein
MKLLISRLTKTRNPEQVLDAGAPKEYGYGCSLRKKEQMNPT